MAESSFFKNSPAPPGPAPAQAPGATPTTSTAPSSFYPTGGVYPEVFNSDGVLAQLEADKAATAASATAAASSASAAATSATDAANSATAAAGSASAASTSATSAATQATNAATSATAAAGSATSAATQATSAASSASGASTSAAGANTAASSASTSATAASTSATNAASSASAASTSATNAATSATNAAASATAAANTAAQLMGKNRVFNGGFTIDQRFLLVSQTVPNGAYTIDRWAFYPSATLNLAGTTVVPVAVHAGGISNCLRLTRANAYVNSVTMIQVIESSNCYELAGQTVTVSFKARKGSGYQGVGFNCQLITGTGVDQGVASAAAGTWTGWASSGSVTPTLTTSFQTFSFSVTLGASVTELAVWFTNTSWSGSGTVNDYVDIADVQLELGSTATAYEKRPYEVEVLLCKRYFEALGRNIASSILIGNYGPAAGACYTSIVFEPKRAQPTITAVGSWQNSNTTGITVLGADLNNALLYVTATALGTAVSYNFNSGSYLSISAEL